jgi:hypothetical protein
MKRLSALLLVLTLLVGLSIPALADTSLLPVPKQQFCDANGAPLAGGTLTFYSPGTQDPKTVYTDSGGGTPAGVGGIVTLDSAGRASVWLSGYYDIVLKTSAGVTVWTVLNVSSMADTTIGQSEWVEQELTLTYIGTTSFSVPGDETSTFQVGRRIKAVVAAGTIYGTITASVYTTPTTVTCSFDSGSLDSGLSAVSVGLISVTNPALPRFTDLSATYQASATQKGIVELATDAEVQTGTDTARAVTPAGLAAKQMRPRCRLYRDSLLAIANATWTEVAWPVANEHEDTDSLHGSTNTSRITVNKAGLWLVSGVVSFTERDTGYRGMKIMVNGASVVVGPNIPAISVTTKIYLSFSQVLPLAANDYVEIFVYQNSGSSLELVADAAGMKFDVIYLGPVA